MATAKQKLCADKGRGKSPSKPKTENGAKKKLAADRGKNYTKKAK